MRARPVLWALCCMLALAPGWLADSVWAQTGPPERIEWKQVPLRLVLRTGSERIVRFPGPVRLGVPASLQPLLRIQSLDGVVYFLAHAAFDPTRIVVRGTRDGRFYLLDVSASGQGGSLAPVEVYVKASRAHGEVPGDAGTGEDRALGRYGYVALTRFAARQLYAPARLAQGSPGIVRVPVSREPVALLRGGAVQAVPLAAWRAGPLHVTAVRLTNRTDRPHTLDPRDLRGTWLAATFQHNRLLPAGSDADTTAVYLISARPFGTSRAGHGAHHR